MKIINKALGFFICKVRPDEFFLVVLWEFGVMYRICGSLAEAEYYQGGLIAAAGQLGMKGLMTAEEGKAMTEREWLIKNVEGLDFRCLYDNIKAERGE